MVVLHSNLSLGSISIPRSLVHTHIQAFSILASLAYVCLAVWLVLFVVFNWDANMTRYSPEFEVKVTRVGNSETNVVIEEKPPEELKQQLQF